MKRGQFNKKYPKHFDFGASLRKPHGESSFARVVRQYKANAKRRNLVFSISDALVRKLTSGNCVYCGVPPMQKMHDKDANGAYIYNGIDRVDKSTGYTKKNCVTACKICNKAKTDLTKKEWQDWIKRIVCFHVAANSGFKKTLEKDEMPKCLQAPNIQS